MTDHPFVRETPGVAGGYPCVGETRIPVRLIVEFTWEGVTVEQLLAMYPHLTAEQIPGALEYYAANPTRLDEDITTNSQVMTLANPSPRRRASWP